MYIALLSYRNYVLTYTPTTKPKCIRIATSFPKDETMSLCLIFKSFLVELNIFHVFISYMYYFFRKLYPLPIFLLGFQLSSLI